MTPVICSTVMVRLLSTNQKSSRWLSSTSADKRTSSSIGKKSSPSSSSECQSINFAELKFYVSSFNENKSPGHDAISADMCKYALKAIGKVALNVYNECIKLCYFPNLWKVGSLVIIPKPGRDSRLLKNLRPITLLPIFGKVYEKWLIDQILSHIEAKNCLSENQYGFREGRSTVDAIYDAVEYTREKWTSGQSVAMVSLDIDGAFDNADWNIIIDRLIEYGVPSNLVDITISYFSDRRTIIRDEGVTFFRKNQKGCPQGSCCGPGFWNILINDLLTNDHGVDMRIQAYADDILIMVPGKNFTSLKTETEKALVSICEWGRENKLTFNPAKTQALVVTNALKDKITSIEFSGTTIALEKSFKYLGVFIDDKLSWTSHLHKRYIQKSSLKP